MSIYADMEGMDAWLAERDSADFEHDDVLATLPPWVCPTCHNSVNGCDYCLPPF